MKKYTCARCGYESEDRNEFVRPDADLGFPEHSLLCHDCAETERDYLDYDTGVF